MKNWQETHRVLDEIAELKARGRRSALAVIVGIEGSAYRRSGAKLLICDDGSLLGNVSGGCLESDVREVGMGLLANGGVRLLHYDTTGREDVVWGFGVGCNGKVDILVQPADSPGVRDTVDAVRNLTKGAAAFALCLVVAGRNLGRMVVVAGGQVVGGGGISNLDAAIAERALTELPSGESRIHEFGESQVFIEVLRPPPSLVVCGAGDDSMPLVRLAADAGFRVTVVDHRPAFLTKERFPDAVALVKASADDAVNGFQLEKDAFAVVKSHVLVQDRGWVKRFADGSARYIGVLGSRWRRDEIIAPLSAEQRRTIYGPIGLDIGAEGPEQIAISVVSEVLAVWSGRTPMHLRDRREAIHEHRSKAGRGDKRPARA